MARAVLRTFLVVRIVRGTLLLAFLAFALVGVEVHGWPRGVTVAVAVAIVADVAALLGWGRRYLDARRAPTNQQRRHP